jgi:hypothetical protein
MAWTTKEAEKALKAAGIDPNPANWTAEDMIRAAEVLDAMAAGR